jgi:hypothetical protein
MMSTLPLQSPSTTVIPTSGLAALQAAYALYRSGGEFYVVDLQKLAEVKTGKCVEVEFFKKQSADILLRRFLENQAIACDLRSTINHFWTNPNTRVFNATESPRVY